MTDPVISELEAIRAEQELEALIYSSMSRDFERRGELDYPERLQDDEELWVNARNVMMAGSIAVVCIAAGLIGYAVGTW